MRLRLWHRLFLALGFLSAGSLCAFAAWQFFAFQRGFLSYLDDHTLARLKSAVPRLAAKYDPVDGWAALQDKQRDFVALIDDRGVIGPPPLSPELPRFEPPAMEAHGPAEPLDLLGRVALFDVNDKRVAGRRSVPRDAPGLPVVRSGVRIGTLRLAPLPRFDTPIEQDFERAQLRSAMIAAMAMVLAALALGYLVARYLLRPINQLASASRALAAGRYETHVDFRGDDEFAALGRDFNHLADTLARNRATARRWGADIAHELRTPVAILKAEVDALRDGVQEPTQAAFASLDAECDRLQSLIEDLYQLSLADAGTLEYSFETLDLRELAEAARDNHERLMQQAGLTLQLELHAVPPVRGDARRLAQLLSNLLSNSRRYTDAPGKVRLATVTVDGAPHLIVEDSSPGVPDAAHARLFERLYRADASRSRADGGAGLGLAIVRSIADAHEATVAASASPLGGLRIVLRFPAAGEPE
jgi:two-component system sensor histidine kinase BaeS